MPDDSAATPDEASSARRAHLRQAVELQRLHRHADAERILRRLLASDPDDAIAHALLADSLLRLEKLPAAIEEIESAIALKPDRAYYHYIYSKILSQTAEFDRAQCEIREAIRLDCEDADYFWLQAVLILIVRNNLRRSLRTIDRGLAVAPNHIGCLRLRGEVLRKMNRLDEARQAFDTALRVDPENAETHRSRGEALFATDHTSEALEHLLEACRLDPVNENSADAIALAAGWKLWPVRWLKPLVPRWYMWSGDNFRWAVLVLCGIEYYLCGLWQQDLLAGRLYLPIMVVAFNLLLAPLTLDIFLQSTIKLLRHRRLGLGGRAIVWQSVLMCWAPGLQFAVSTLAPIPSAMVALFTWSVLVRIVLSSFTDELDEYLPEALRITCGLAVCVTSIYLVLRGNVDNLAWLGGLCLFSLPAFFSNDFTRLLWRR